MDDKALAAAHIKVAGENMLRDVGLEIYNDQFPKYNQNKLSDRESLIRIINILEKHFLAKVNYKIGEYNKLQHHYDSTIGLWCTDKPEIIPKDKKHLFFQLSGQ